MNISLSPVRTAAVFFAIVCGLLLILRPLASYLTADDFGGTYYFWLQLLDTGLLIVTVLFGAFLGFALVTFLVALVIWIIKSLMAAPVMAETNFFNQLIGIVGVALCFSGLLTEIYNFAWNTVSSLFSSFPSQLVNAFDIGSRCIEDAVRSNSAHGSSSCIPSFLWETISAVSGLISSVFGPNGLGRISPVQSILAVALYALIGIVSSKARSHLEPAERFWLAYGGVAVFATYLTLSAILAVPLLEDSSNGSPRPAEELRTKLASMSPNQLSQPFDEGGTAGVTRIETHIALVEGLDVAVARTLSRASTRAKELDAGLRKVVRRANMYGENLLSANNTQLESAVAAYEAERQRHGQREANRHFIDIIEWFRFVSDRNAQLYSICSGSSQHAVDLHSGLAGQVQSIATSGQDLGGDIADEMDFALGQANSIAREIDESYRVVFSAVRNAELDCAPEVGVRHQPPPRQSFGSYLGIVGFATSWLLGAENMQVALIVGLIGFGLLGSLVANFVGPQNESEDFSLFRIATIVFTGFTAAIVVYVASYGGLAIASVSGQDPNPYIVFGACLVGAVYSNEIWRRAKNVLFSDQPQNGNGQNKDEASG